MITRFNHLAALALALAAFSMQPPAVFGEEVATEQHPAIEQKRRFVDSSVTRTGATPAADRPRIASFSDRISAHASVIRLLSLRRQEALANPEEFWEGYKLGGQEETLARPVTHSFVETPLLEVLGEFGEAAGMRFETTTDYSDRLVKLNVAETPASEILIAISKQVDVVPIYDRFEDVYVLVDLRERVAPPAIQEYSIPVRLYEADQFLELCKQLGFDPADGEVNVDPESNSLLFKGDAEKYREIQSLFRDLDRLPPPAGESYQLEAIELQHREPRGVILQLRRAFRGNFASRGQKIGMAVTPENLEAARILIAEYDRPTPPDQQSE